MSLMEKLSKAKVSNALFADLSEEDIALQKLLASVSVRLIKERQKRNMDQKAFAEFMEVSQGMVSKWESGEYNFTIVSLAKHFAKLDMKVNVTFEESCKETVKPDAFSNVMEFSNFKNSQKKEFGWTVPSHVNSIRTDKTKKTLGVAG